MAFLAIALGLGKIIASSLAVEGVMYGIKEWTKDDSEGQTAYPGKGVALFDMAHESQERGEYENDSNTLVGAGIGIGVVGGARLGYGM